MLFAAVAVYVLSFGPLWNLTTTKMGHGGMRPAKLPNCADAVNTVYAPLIHVLVTPPPWNALQSSLVVHPPL